MSDEEAVLTRTQELFGFIPNLLREVAAINPAVASVYLEGSTEAVLTLACSRCLERYRHAFSEVFRLVLEPAGDRVPADPEGARQLSENGLYVSDELEYGWFAGPELVLDDYFAELVALHVPVQPVCREDCLGLCSVCGVDRNRKPCSCVETPVHQPFAGLAALRDKLAERKGDRS